MKNPVTEQKKSFVKTIRGGRCGGYKERQYQRSRWIIYKNTHERNNVTSKHLAEDEGGLSKNNII